MSENINGKVVVITGASSGLGAETARHLAKEGAKVILGARRLGELVPSLSGLPPKQELTIPNASRAYNRRTSWLSWLVRETPVLV